MLRGEVGQEFGIGEMLQAQGIVGHDIGLPWDVLCHVAVTVVSLVLGSKDALLGGRTICRDGLLDHAGLRRGVLNKRSHGSALDGVVLCCGADLGEHAGVFKVTVRDGAIWVVGRNQSGLCFSWEGGAPHEWVSFSFPMDASHASLCGVCCAKMAGILRDDLS